jgi:hypothetical protein
MCDIKVLNNKCKMGGCDVGPQCFVKYLLLVVNLVCKKEVICICKGKAVCSSDCVCFEQGLSCTDLCPCQAGEICRNSNTQMHILSYAPRVINRLVYKSCITQ